MLLEAILGSNLKKWRHIAVTTLPLRDQISVAVGLARCLFRQLEGLQRARRVSI